MRPESSSPPPPPPPASSHSAPPSPQTSSSRSTSPPPHRSSSSQPAAGVTFRLRPLGFFSLLLLALSVLASCPSPAAGVRDFAFFNTTSLVTIPNSDWDLRSRKEVTFRTCSGSGSLIFLRGSLSSSSLSPSSSSSSPTSSSSTSSSASAATSSSSSSSWSSSVVSSSSHELTLSLLNGSVVMVWSVNGQSGAAHVGRRVNDNLWHTVQLKYYLGVVTLSLASDGQAGQDTVIVANATHNAFLLDVRLSGNLQVGRDFTGCMYPGPGVNFGTPGLPAQQVTWDSCPLQRQLGCTKLDRDIDDC
ncbi:putative protein TPRXL, partial [Aplysia californica]|uniref:Laminin G domain-containing protein n=1 Tax=Aplysia californica TaxID=6500 RepID=A0ABM1A439_APLCA